MVTAGNKAKCLYLHWSKGDVGIIITMRECLHDRALQWFGQLERKEEKGQFGQIFFLVCGLKYLISKTSFLLKGS